MRRRPASSGQAPSVLKTAGSEELPGGPVQACHLGGPDRLLRGTEARARARTHLDDDEQAGDVKRDDVQLEAADPDVPAQDAPSHGREVGSHGILCPVAGHPARRLAAPRLSDLTSFHPTQPTEASFATAYHGIAREGPDG
jgi:hypothetical protein